MKWHILFLHCIGGKYVKTSAHKTKLLACGLCELTRQNMQNLQYGPWNWLSTSCVLVCHFGHVSVCVFSVGVKGHCVGGHQGLCEGSGGMLFWSRTRWRTSGKGQGKKVQTLALVRVCLPQLGPCMDTHINTPGLSTLTSHCNTHTHTDVSQPSHRRPLGCRVGKHEETEEQEKLGICLARVEMLMSWRHMTVACPFVDVKGQRSWPLGHKLYNHNN